MGFGTVEQALTDIAAGKFVIVADDEGRENEGAHRTSSFRTSQPHVRSTPAACEGSGGHMTWVRFGRTAPADAGEPASTAFAFWSRDGA